MELIEILEISERDSKFQTKINVEMIWMDARIDIYNLKDDANLNTLPASERSIIWVPKLTFNNTKTNVQTVNDGKSIASVRKMGNYTKSPITFADNIFIFKVIDHSFFYFFYLSPIRVCLCHTLGIFQNLEPTLFFNSFRSFHFLWIMVNFLVWLGDLGISKLLLPLTTCF